MAVGLVIVSHSRQLALGVAELATQLTQGKTPIAAAGGAVDDILGTSADKIVTAIQAVDSPSGVLILLDLGSALLSTEMALELLDPEQHSRVILSYAPLVEGTIAAALAASLGHPLMDVKRAAEKAADRSQLLQLKPLDTEVETETTAEPSLSSSAPAPSPLTGVVETQLTLTNPTGLHARPASLFVQMAAHFNAHVEARGRGKQTEATSIFGILSLGLRQGDTLLLRASGAEAQQALEALSELVQANFYETSHPTNTSDAPSIVMSEASSAMPLSSTTSSPATSGSWQGISTSPGAAVGPALLYTSDNLVLSAVQRRSIAPEQVTTEQQRLRNALITTAQELQDLVANVQQHIGRAEAAIFEAQALMLQDPVLLDAALHMIEEQQLSAASSLAASAEQQALMLEGLENSLLAARAVDVRDAAARALLHLGAQRSARQDLSVLDHPVILVAQDLTPSDTAQLRPETVLGICTVHGGPTAHAAILARALGIPAIAGLSDAALQTLHSGDELGLDADNGLLYYQPSPVVRNQLRQRFDTQQQQRAVLKAAAQQSNAPLNFSGRHISLFANIGSEAEAEAAQQWGAEGIGLLRTEFLFAQATTLPSEAEQRHRYAQVFKAFSKNRAPQSAGPMVVRTLDAGADKPMPSLEKVIGPMQEANPALGLRGIRISLAHQQLLELQLRALLLAAVDTGIELHIMFPMIATCEELGAARDVFNHVYEELSQQHIALPAHVPIGIMVEVPAAATMSPELAELADFFSIGANDLLQYTLAADRTNASLASLYHPMQPAVLRLIAQIAAAGRQAGKTVAVCGEIASNVLLAPLLIGLGVDELSMTPTALPAVRAALVRHSAQELSELAQKVLHLRTVAEVEQACKAL